jgi:hypothetical protein
MEEILISTIPYKSLILELALQHLVIKLFMFQIVMISIQLVVFTTKQKLIKTCNSLLLNL